MLVTYSSQKHNVFLVIKTEIEENVHIHNIWQKSELLLLRQMDIECNPSPNKLMQNHSQDLIPWNSNFLSL